jgi:hypothetical protein
MGNWRNISCWAVHVNICKQVLMGSIVSDGKPEIYCGSKYLQTGIWVPVNIIPVAEYIAKSGSEGPTYIYMQWLAGLPGIGYISMYPTATAGYIDIKVQLHLRQRPDVGKDGGRCRGAMHAQGIGSSMA